MTPLERIWPGSGNDLLRLNVGMKTSVKAGRYADDFEAMTSHESNPGIVELERTPGQGGFPFRITQF